MSNNYVVYHLHDDYSLSDSCTKWKDYVDRAVELGQTAIANTPHGNIFNWLAKKRECDKAGIKFIHGCEVYLTEMLFHTNEKGDKYKIRDNYHTILLAKNLAGVKELNKLISISNDKDHFYFKPRISFEEFLNMSDNIISTSACLASPLFMRNFDRTEDKISQCILKLEEAIINAPADADNIMDMKNLRSEILEELEFHDNIYQKLCKKYTYYEIQAHVNSPEQKELNVYLVDLSKKYNKPLIAGTDTHSINSYKAECRSILQKSKKIEFTNEDEYDLTYKTYEELVQMFKDQGVLDESIYLEAIENTNVMANSIEEYNIDLSTKYPYLYENDEEVFIKRIWDMLDDKLQKGVIKKEQESQFREDIEEEIRVFKKVNMCGFMLSMSEITCWCAEQGIPLGPARGSVGGSRVAYVTGITDLNPVTWRTIFSRFCNEDREEVGDKVIVSTT